MSKQLAMTNEERRMHEIAVFNAVEELVIALDGTWRVMLKSYGMYRFYVQCGTDMNAVKMMQRFGCSDINGFKVVLMELEVNEYPEVYMDMRMDDLRRYLYNTSRTDGFDEFLKG